MSIRIIPAPNAFANDGFCHGYDPTANGSGDSIGLHVTLCGKAVGTWRTSLPVDCPECLEAINAAPVPDLCARCRERIEEIAPSWTTDTPAPYTPKPRKPSRAEALEDAARLNRLFCDQVLREWEAKDPSEVTPAENVLLDFLRGVRERNDEALRTEK